MATRDAYNWMQDDANGNATVKQPLKNGTYPADKECPVCGAVMVGSKCPSCGYTSRKGGASKPKASPAKKTSKNFNGGKKGK